MALRTTPTIAICLTAGITAGVALARPADEAAAPAAGTTGYEIDGVEPGATGSGYGDPIADATADATDDGTGDGSTDATATDSTAAAITIESFDFSTLDPVAPGTEIAVTNVDPSTHTLTARDGAFDTGSLRRDQVVTITAPTDDGAYEYFCKLHPSMVGTLTVSD